MYRRALGTRGQKQNGSHKQEPEASNRVYQMRAAAAAYSGRDACGISGVRGC